MLRIDHVVRAVPDLDQAAARFLDTYGLASVPGGRHPGWGTGNRLVPLGNDYVELISVVDRPEAQKTEFGRTMVERIAEGEQWFAVCLADDDIDATATRLGLEISTGFRILPDGAVVRWRSAGLGAANREPWLPFFIEWDVPPELHPARAAVTHRAVPTGIAWVELAGDSESLQRWLGGADLPFRMIDGKPDIRSVGIAIDEGPDLKLG
ncbi:MAG TPA: VOC family protein [Actinomycetota bacterium]|nr:VOC family protein [Actinomycetota bacterium]